MTEPAAENLSFFWSTVALRELHRRGIRHAVISPGSRSTPLTLAAAAHPGLKKDVILDERSAGFHALGLAKATGIPALLICTSGTAVANYYPAVIEARQSHVPMVLLTADRPPGFRGTGANQTIDQLDIFGGYPLMFQDVSMPSTQPVQQEKLRKLSKKAADIAFREKGPVHLNFPFEKPLEPIMEFVKQTERENKAGIHSENPTPSPPPVPPAENPPVTPIVEQAEKPLMVIGQLPAGVNMDSIYKWGSRLRIPILSEQGGFREGAGICGYDGFLRNPDNIDKLKPDLLLRFGLQPASKSLLEAITSWRPEHHIYFSSTGRKVDVAGTTTRQVGWNGEDLDWFPRASGWERWLQTWKRAEAGFMKHAQKVVEHTQPLTDGHIYHELESHIPESWFIFLSNSFPVRDHMLLGKRVPNIIFTNRGASGIDGITSTVMGISSGLRQPGVLITGDLAFLHDTNALLNHKKLSETLIVVIVNNKGGSIFRMLPIAGHSSYFETYFETPQEVSISKLVSAYDLSYTCVKTVGELRKIQLKQLAGASSTPLHILECQTDPGESMKLRNKLWEFEL